MRPVHPATLVNKTLKMSQTKAKRLKIESCKVNQRCHECGRRFLARANDHRCPGCGQGEVLP